MMKRFSSKDNCSDSQLSDAELREHLVTRSYCPIRLIKSDHQTKPELTILLAECRFEVGIFNIVWTVSDGQLAIANSNSPADIGLQRSF